MSTLLAAYVKQLAIILLDLAESNVVGGMSRAECQACLQRFSGSSEESCLYVISQGDGPSKSLALTTEWSSEGHSMSARIALIKLRDRPIVDTEPINQQTQLVTGPTVAIGPQLRLGAQLPLGLHLRSRPQFHRAHKCC